MKPSFKVGQKILTGSVTHEITEVHHRFVHVQAIERSYPKYTLEWDKARNLWTVKV